MKIRDMLKKTGNIKFNSLLLKYFMIISAIVIIPLSILSVTYYGYYNQSLTQELESSNKYTALKVKDITEMVFSEVKQLLIQICMDEDLQGIVGYNRTMFPDYNSIYRYSALIRSFNIKSLTSDYIQSISVYSIPNDYVFSTFLGGSENAYYKDNEWIGRAVENAGKTGFYIEARTFAGIAEADVISCIGYTPVDTRAKKGAVSVDIDANHLKNLITTINDDYFEKIIIADEHGNIILNAYDTAGDGSSFFQSAREQLLSKNTDSAIIRYDGVGYVAALAVSESTRFSYLFATPVNVYVQKLQSLRRFMLFALLAGVAFSLALAYFMSLKVYEPIRSIRDLVENDANLTVEYKKNKIDEYHYIIDNIKHSYKLSDDIHKELQYRLALLDQAKASALQSHINPHFLCNTLETVNFMALRALGDNNDISRMVVSLSLLLRQSLETENAFTSLRDETIHAEEYIKIQKCRYRDRFDMRWDIGGDCLDCRVIKIMLQPLLENAIDHGIRPMPSPGLIRVQARIEGALLVVTVEDDGVGMSPETIDRLNDGLDEEYIRRNHHIGLMNVNQRIKLLFGEMYGLRVTAGPGGRGAVVTVSLPVIREG